MLYCMVNGQGEQVPPSPQCTLFHINHLSEVMLKPLYPISKLSLENNCLLWGLQTVIPGSLQARLFKERHENHLVTA